MNDSIDDDTFGNRHSPFKLVRLPRHHVAIAILAISGVVYSSIYSYEAIMGAGKGLPFLCVFWPLFIGCVFLAPVVIAIKDYLLGGIVACFATVAYAIFVVGIALTYGWDSIAYFRIAIWFVVELVAIALLLKPVRDKLGSPYSDSPTA